MKNEKKKLKKMNLRRKKSQRNKNLSKMKDIKLQRSL
jgi:hypothetical protein